MDLRSKRIVVLTLLLATAVTLSVSLVFLTRYPVVFIDEPWYSDVAWNLVTTGVDFDTMHAGALDQWPDSWVRWPLIGNLPFAGAFTLFGLGLFQARITSWAFGVLLVGAVFVLGRRLYDNIAAALAALFLSLSALFLQASHYARPDIFLALVVVSALYLYVVGTESQKRWPFFVTGLLFGLALDIHLNALPLGLALGVYHLLALRKTVFRDRSTWLLIAGASIGVIYYLALHVLPNPETYAILSRAWQGTSHRPPLASLNPLVWAKAFLHEVGRYHFFENGLEFALIGASFTALVLRRSRADRFLVTYLGAALLLFTLLLQNKHDVYAILLYPLMMIGVGGAFSGLLQESSRSRLQATFVAALLVFSLASAGVRYVRPMLNSRAYDYDRIAETIKAVIPSDQRVMGLPNWWLGLADYDYRSSLNLTYYHFYNGYSLTQGLEADRPDYLIVDSGLRGLLVDEGAFPPGPGFAIYKLPRQEFEGFLAQRGTKILVFDNPWHGKFEIYKIDWTAHHG